MRKLNKNPDITKKAAQYGIFYYQIAAQLGIADTTFSRMMRRKLDDATTTRVLKIIEELARGGVGDMNESVIHA